ncbi:MAG: hypothetical protein A2857_00445 [Candidatus Levybacteria bacterium RIFCSPHIGHO2_01_FULL_36_15]|nr:MAG: hypothetical protein A2857_00445 [Candidatus Levybacteria bacterium RIFCSPHIGHO2_01_FULL_36_15]OGH38840.1 MAG: hypothetical protein A2905_03025 [Candidatus Levybacteria bacterium RIFCSPLOWO2_01_FULL_36_10]
MGFLGKKKIILISLFILIVGGAGVFIFVLGSSNKKPEAKKTLINQENIKQLKPEDIGLSLTPRADKKAVNMVVTKFNGVSSFDYEVNYNASGNIPRGVIGSIDVKSAGPSIKREILLGTCSRNVCKYDQGVTEVDFLIKVNFANGEIGSVQQKLNL